MTDTLPMAQQIPDITDIYEELRHSIMMVADKKRLDPSRDIVEISDIISRVVHDHNESCALLGEDGVVDVDATVVRLQNSVFGYGALHSILLRNDVEEVFIEGARVSYIDSTGFCVDLLNLQQQQKIAMSLNVFLLTPIVPSLLNRHSFKHAF